MTVELNTTHNPYTFEPMTGVKINGKEAMIVYWTGLLAEKDLEEVLQRLKENQYILNL